MNADMNLAGDFQWLNRSSGPPLVLIHSVSGDISEYAALARALQPTAHVAAIASPLRAAVPAKLPSLRELASMYAASLVHSEIGSPVALAGWAIGGVLAWEVAREMAAAGDRVTCAILIDSRAPHPSMAARDTGPLAIARAYIQRALRSAGRADPVPEISVSADPADASGRPTVHLAEAVYQQLQRLDVTSDARNPGELHRQLVAFQAHVQAFVHHQTGVLDVPVLLLETIDQVPDHPKPPTLGWDELAPQLTKLATPGNHFTAVSGDNVAALAAQIGAFVARHREIR